MITGSLIWGGARTFDQLKELDWLEQYQLNRIHTPHSKILAG
jgi:hypothetical protein